MNGKRKFMVTGFVLVSSAVMVFAGKMEGAGWITLATLCLSIYGAQNIVDKKMGGQG